MKSAIIKLDEMWNTVNYQLLDQIYGEIISKVLIRIRYPLFSLMNNRVINRVRTNHITFNMINAYS